MRRETTLVFTVVLTLVSVGILMVFSVTAVDGDPAGVLKRQLTYAVIGLVAMCVMARFDYHRLRDPYVYLGIVAIALGLLVLVLIPGIGVRVDGAQRWIRIGSFQFQPSELAKFALIVLLAVKLTQNLGVRNHLLKGYLPPLAIGLLFAGLIYAERDLGVPVVIMSVALAMMWAAGIHWAYISVTGALCAGGVLALAIITPHRWQRLIAFLDPWAHRDDASFQLVQSLRAFAQGGFSGVGLGASEQKLHYLFAAHTDFIFAVLGEELGMRGTLFVVGLLALFVWGAFRIAMNARDLFGTLLATGISVLIVFQATFIICVTTGLLPTKGLPLPFVSYGGTSLIVFMALAGILISIGAQAGLEEPARRALLPGRTAAAASP
jgi:cell division protein FtsW